METQQSSSLVLLVGNILGSRFFRAYLSCGFYLCLSIPHVANRLKLSACSSPTIVVADPPEPPLSFPPLPFRMPLIMLGHSSELITLAGFVMRPVLSINPNFLSVSPSCLNCSKEHWLVQNCAKIAARFCSFRSDIRCLQSMKKRVNQSFPTHQLTLMVLAAVLIRKNGRPGVGCLFI